MQMYVQKGLRSTTGAAKTIFFVFLIYISTIYKLTMEYKSSVNVQGKLTKANVFFYDVCSDGSSVAFSALAGRLLGGRLGALTETANARCC